MQVDTGWHFQQHTDLPSNGLFLSPHLATLSPVPLTVLPLQLQEAFQVKPNFKFEGCSSKVAAALGPDVMKSVKHLIPDLLSALPVLLYQGMSNAFINVVACTSECKSIIVVTCHHLHLGTYHSNAIYKCSWYSQLACFIDPRVHFRPARFEKTHGSCA